MPFSKSTSWRYVLFLLVYAYIIYIVSEGELRDVRIAAVGADGEVQQQVVAEAWDGVGKGIFGIAGIALVEGLREVDLVEKIIVEVETDILPSPVHTPDVELVGPALILVRKLAERDDF